jgi:hypothetical protein
MVALHSDVLDSITLLTPWSHHPVLHSHVRTATGRVRLTSSRHLSLSPCPLQLHDPCTGREGGLHPAQRPGCTRVWSVVVWATPHTSPQWSHSTAPARVPLSLVGYRQSVCAVLGGTVAPTASYTLATPTAAPPLNNAHDRARGDRPRISIPRAVACSVWRVVCGV